VSLEIEHSSRDGCEVVACRGRIDLFTAPRVQRKLLKHLGERPLAVICELSGVDAVEPVCAGVFSSVANHPASWWPGTGLLLCGARPAVAETLARLQVPRFLRLCADLEEALEQAVARPPYLRDELRLPPIASAPASARRFAREVCDYWRIALPGQDLIDRMVLLTGELVIDAVAHARGDVLVRVELRGDRLHIAVRDPSPRLLRLVKPEPEDAGGRGLRLVERLSRASGVTRHPDGGKVVWCVLELWPPPAATGGA
jgi:anti-anti-sigma regulatory factor